MCYPHVLFFWRAHCFSFPRKKSHVRTSERIVFARPLPDFIPWEPGTSYPFCRTEVKKDGGKCERRLAQNGFCSSKKSHK